MKKRTKRTFSWHHWCGLVAGIFILILSLTGAVQVFHEEIDETVYQNVQKLNTPASKIALANSYEIIRQNNPGWDIRLPNFRPKKNQALKYELRQELKRKWIFVHPETGKILHTINRADRRFTQLLLELHYTLFAGTFGKIIVLLAGICLLILTITGLLLYRRSLLKVLTFRQKLVFTSKRSFFSGLHRIIGVWSLVFNLLISASGISLAIGVVNGAFKKKDAKMEAPAMLVSPDKMLKAAQKQYPDFEIHYLRFPVKKDGKFVARGRFRNDPAVYGDIYSTLEIDTKTGEIVKTNFLRDLNWFDRNITVLNFLHFGEFGGIFTKLLYCFFGFMPGILAISGFAIWRFRSKNLRLKSV